MSRTVSGSRWRGPRTGLQRASPPRCSTFPPPGYWPRSRQTRSFSNCRTGQWTRWNATASSSIDEAGHSPVSCVVSTRPKPKRMRSPRRWNDTSARQPSPRRPNSPYCLEASADLGVAEAVSRFRADIRMDYPAPQNPFPLQPGFFHDTGRGGVLDIAYGAYAPDRVQAHSPVDELYQRFRHQTAPPIKTGQHVSEVEHMRLGPP